MGTLDDLAADIGTNLWLDDGYFAEDIYYFPKSVAGDKETLKATFDTESLEGTNEAHGDGRTIASKQKGVSERQSVVVYVPVSATVTRVQEEGRPDRLERVSDGKIWTVKRVLSEDAACIKLLCIRQKTESHRSYQREG